MIAGPESSCIHTASQALRRGETTSLELTELALQRAQRDELNCFIAIEADRALAQARLRDEELKLGHWRGPLHGIPLAHKDMFQREGFVSTAGSKILVGKSATLTATVIARLDVAGAIDVGRLNMSEFAAGPTGHNATFGDCLNARDPLLVAGGSSSGSASAVAAGIVFGALGSDTGGSIRLPSAFNGVVGLKPTYGMVSRFGSIARAWSLDHVGPIARTARDCAIILEAISGPDPKDPTTTQAPPFKIEGWPKTLDGIRLGVARDLDESEIDSEILAATKEACRTLADAGAEIIEVPKYDYEPVYQVAQTIIKCESAAMHEAWLRERRQDYSSHVRNRIDAGFLIPATTYINALRLRQVLLNDFCQTVLSDVDFLISPTVGAKPPRIAHSSPDDSPAATIEMVTSLTKFTRPFNLLGLPSLSVPVTCGELPVGLQLIGRAFADAHLLAAAHAIESLS